jgi:single-stranded-DNA-specific exonuclease
MPHIQRREMDMSLPLLPRILQSRGLDASALEFGLKNLADFSSLKGIDNAVALLVAALQKKQRILIIGDFDVDGATSTTLAVDALQKMGAHWVHYLVPNRFEYGYGLSPAITQLAFDEFKPDLIVTVDNGIASFEGVTLAKKLGMQVLITDHHLAAANLPDANAIVNPNQPGCLFPSKAACGCAVIFYVMCALKRRLVNDNLLADSVINMAEYLDLVALASVADVVPLDNNNRILVEQGLRRIRKGFARPGIMALLKVSAKLAERLTSKDFGFALGPRLNAAGRMDDMSIGIECLLSQTPAIADELAQQLDDLNQDRKAVEGVMQQEALRQLTSVQLDEQNMPAAICLYDANWHQGVVGLLASRIKERYHRPVIAFAPGDNGELKGSARSIPGFHLRDALDLVAKRKPHLLTKFGGHAMAAGLSLRSEDFAEFTAAFVQVATEQITPEQLVHTLITDGPLTAHEYNLDNAHQLRFCAPWGQQFPEPLFDDEFILVNQRLLAEKHLKMTLKPVNGGPLLDAIAFNVDVKKWPNNQCQRVHLVFEMDANFFREQWSLQLMVRDIRAL